MLKNSKKDLKVCMPFVIKRLQAISKICMACILGMSVKYPDVESVRTIIAERIGGGKG